jgi:hypothetical protein
MSVNKTNRDALQAFYLEAALKCYATGEVEKTTIPELPGSRVYRYERDGLLYIDTYFVNGNLSCGQTMIFRDGQPVWQMQYHGWCDKDYSEVVPTFLKTVLRFTYTSGIWNGGRGPVKLEDGPDGTGLVYSNARVEGDFSNFRGGETIFIPGYDAEVVFWHDYSGFLLDQDEDELEGN